MDANLKRTESVEAYEDLCCMICWDEDEDPESKLNSGVYAVCGGEWRREENNQWRFWENEAVMADLRGSHGAD